MKPEECVVGEVYTWLFPRFCTWTAKFSFVSKTSVTILTGIHYNHSNSGKSALGTGVITWDNELAWIRLATFDEKQHLLQCIAAGEYVEYKKFNNLTLNYLIL